jgi:ribosome-associated translation inhibitor RaiA
MEYPLNVTFHHIPRSAQIVTFVNKRANKLNCFSDRITNCRVVIDAHHDAGKNGNLFRVRVILSFPDRKIIVGNNPRERHLYKSLSYAIIDTFDTAYNLVWTYLHSP